MKMEKSSLNRFNLSIQCTIASEKYNALFVCSLHRSSQAWLIVKIKNE